MPDITIDFLQTERIAIMWFNGKPRAARYVTGSIIHWHRGDTIRDAVMTLLDYEAQAHG